MAANTDPEARLRGLRSWNTRLLAKAKKEVDFAGANPSAVALASLESLVKQIRDNEEKMGPLWIYALEIHDQDDEKVKELNKLLDAFGVSNAAVMQKLLAQIATLNRFLLPAVPAAAPPVATSTSTGEVKVK